MINRAYDFVQLDQPEPERDRWERITRNGVVFDRISSRSDAVVDKYNLTPWEIGLTVEGLQDDPELLKRDDLTPKQIGKLAAVAAGLRAGSEAGTRIHSAVEAILLRERIPDDVTDEDVADALAILTLVDQLGFDVVLSEVLVVNEPANCAGTADLALRHRATGVAIIGDIKSSKRNLAGSLKFNADHGWATQIACYAGAQPVGADGNLRTWEDVIGVELAQDYGLVLHVQRGKALAEACPVDLAKGREQSSLAQTVKAARKDTYAVKNIPGLLDLRDRKGVLTPAKA